MCPSGSLDTLHSIFEPNDLLRTMRSCQTRSEVAHGAIRQAILSGQMPPHERLVEERLAEALDIGRTPVREALAILELQRLLESEPYKGLAVRPVMIDEFLNMDGALGVIEAALARAAATNATGADIRRMDAALHHAEAAIPIGDSTHDDTVRGHRIAAGGELCPRLPRH